MTVVSFFVPGQPQGKARPIAGFKFAKGGVKLPSMRTPQKTLAYEGMIAHIAHQAMAGRDLLEGPCSVSLDIVLQIPSSWSQRKQAQAEAGSIKPTTKPDASNVLKAVEDGCNGVVWKDDAQAVQITMAKRYGTNPGVTVVIAYAYPGLYTPAQQEEIAA